jgi:4'-phosphopantetheinyl transferase
MPPHADDAFAWSAENIHVWTINLEPDAWRQQELADLLSPDETAKAGKFQFPRDQRRYAVARGALRKILAGYLTVEPTGIEFAYGPTGKPSLASAPSALHFSVSHSRDLAAIAVCKTRVGVDVERLDARPTLPLLAERLFPPAEKDEWLALTPREQVAAFYRSWTWKEAYLKATGQGFASSNDGFSLRLARGDRLQMPAAWQASGDKATWSFAHFSPAEDFIGAVAVEGDELRMRAREWPPVTPRSAEESSRTP